MTAPTVGRSSVVAYARLSLVELVRIPAFLLPTLAFPAVLFLFFGRPSAHSPDQSWGIVVSFAAVAVLGVLLFQFGVGIAAERESAWERYVRTLGAPTWKRLAARIVSALLFSIASLMPLTVMAIFTTDLAPSAVHAVAAVFAVLAGSIPFGLLGVAIGYWAPPRGALPITNLVYLPLAYLGGLFGDGAAPRSGLQRVVGWLPTRIWLDIVSAAARGQTVWNDTWRLALWGVAFFVAAWFGYNRDQGRQYR